MSRPIPIQNSRANTELLIDEGETFYRSESNTKRYIKRLWNQTTAYFDHLLEGVLLRRRNIAGAGAGS